MTQPSRAGSTTAVLLSGGDRELVPRPGPRPGYPERTVVGGPESGIGPLWLNGVVTTAWDEEFHPSTSARSAMRWAEVQGASTLGEAYDLLDQLEVSNDVPEVLGHDDTVEGVRDELEGGIELVGADAALDGLL